MQISILLLMCALSLSGVAAYYSIVGLAAIFAGAFWPVVIMSAILEISKLVVTSWLYQRWDKIPFMVKTYLTSAVVILMMITSLGIYGFLSRAHAEQDLGSINNKLSMEQIDQQIATVVGNDVRFKTQLDQLDRSINIQLDGNRATQALTARKDQQKERDAIQAKLDQDYTQLQELNAKKSSMSQEQALIVTKTAPIRYVAAMFVGESAADVDSAVRYMTMLLVLVFDPLAVLMIIAANMSLVKNEKTPTHQIGEIAWDSKTEQFTRWTGVEWRPETPKTIVPETPVPVDLDSVKATVQQTMDQWLKSAGSSAPDTEVKKPKRTYRKRPKIDQDIPPVI
jgi:hypothetical protein